MQVYVLISLWLSVVHIFAETPDSPQVYDISQAETYFKDYLRKYNKLYADQNEYDQRLINFKITLQRLNEANKNPVGRPYILNNYADLNDEERNELPENNFERNNEDTNNDQIDLDSSMNIVSITGKYSNFN